ncbi:MULTISPECIES: zinc-dependent alcohol dehydrogenase [Anaerotruncus]|uniref:zinc-dependent alcohol dehydrogenase n=1 Tax=Anaerotruncus TaxID=244127 RepID=UPI000829F4F1|nr:MULTISPECIES: alcohol dehydrogenase catalytic domain-containing protein [Anaerotruncus]RGX53615.1 hypothetical protein DWV16_16450 [Anaerotruncus sp. AF02-27]
MKALQVFAPNEMRLVETEIPAIKHDTQVLVRITAAGICGSDVHILHGSHPYVTYPRIIGHEGCGIVEKTGAAVADLKVGDGVVIEPIRGCGRCYACRHGKYNICPDIVVAGVHEDGTFAEYMVVDRSQLHKYDPSLTPVQAAVAEPYTVGAQANYRADTLPGDLVLVHGAGPIGLIVCDIAHTRGATVIVSEVNEKRLGMAPCFGAKYTVNPMKEDLGARVMEISGGEGANVIFEASGVPKLTEQSIGLLSPGGRFVPMTFGAQPIPVNFMPVNKNEITIAGTRNQNGKFPDIVASLPGRIDRIDRLVTHVFPITEYQKAFDTLADRDSGACKVVLTF